MNLNINNDDSESYSICVIGASGDLAKKENISSIICIVFGKFTAS